MIIKRIIRLILITLSPLLLHASVLEKCHNRTIISQSPYITHSIDFFGLKECIVGASIYDTQVSQNLPRTGKVFIPDKEAIQKIQADFIFTSDWTARRTLTDVTPLQSKSFILHGFQSMQQIENNLYAIGNVLKIPDFQSKVALFSKEWKALAHSIKAKNKKVLLMSACSKNPHSYGRKTYLGDLFSAAGFDVVDVSKKIKIFNIQKNELNTFIKEFKPELIFGIVPYTKGGTCSVLETNRKLPIIYLNGDMFMHPSPTLIEGLKELKSKENQW